MKDVLTVFGAVLLAASIIYAAKRFRMERPRVGQRPTIEQEMAESYAVAAHANQWGYERPEVPDDHQYGYFDLDDTTPEAVSDYLNHVREARQRLM